MTKEELINAIFSGVNLDRYRKASIEQFIKETDDLTIDNFIKKYHEWIGSGKNKKVFEQEHQEVLDETDTKIKIGINAIRNNDYTSDGNPDSLSRFNMDRVRCNATGLYGLITPDGEEIVPCCFDDINIHLDGVVEAVFKDMKCNLLTVNREAAESFEGKKKVLLYGKTGALIINAPKQNPLSEQLFNLL